MAMTQITTITDKSGTAHATQEDLMNQMGLSQAQLKKKLERNYNLVKNFGGYEGTLTSFGFPIVRHGQTVRVVDTIYEQRDTMHLVDQVEISASPDGGYRRVLELGKEVL